MDRHGHPAQRRRRVDRGEGGRRVGSVEALSSRCCYQLALTLSIVCRSCLSLGLMLVIRMNLKGFTAASKAFIEASRGEVVSQDHMAARFSVCQRGVTGQGCPRYTNKKPIMTRISAILGRMVNKHRVPDAIAKKSCGACGCSMLLLIPSKVLKPDSERQAALRPSWCWVNQEKEHHDRTGEPVGESTFHPSVPKRVVGTPRETQRGRDASS